MGRGASRGEATATAQYVRVNAGWLAPKAAQRKDEEGEGKATTTEVMPLP